MCPRYKDSNAPTPEPSPQRRGITRAQAQPSPRVQASLPQETRGEEYRTPPQESEKTESLRFPPPPRRTAARHTPRPLPPPADTHPTEKNRSLPEDEEPGNWRTYGQQEPAAVNPIEEFRRPPRQGMSLGHGVWLLLTLPFRMIAFLTRAAPRLILWPLRLGLSLAFVGFILLVILAIVYGIKADRYDITQVLRMPERSIVLDRKGNEIGALHGENRRSINRLHEEVPPYFIDALILQEDRSFWNHHGIDPRGMMRAVAQVFKHHRTTQGASTLTMQLAKTTYNHRRRNFDAKFTEMALARRIEATYDKTTILTCYINRIFWGHTFMGLKQAANGYFSKRPSELSIGEAAMLAGIICSPNEFSPYRNLSAARVQRDKVLKLMYEHGKITRVQYDTALAEEIIPRLPERRGIDNYALDLARSEVDHILSMLEAQDRGIKEETIYSGGLKVHTTLDVDLQDDVMREMDARLVQMLERQKRYPHQTRAQFQALKAQLPPEEAERLRPKYIQAACVIIDNATGALLAVVGGRDSTESPLNRAVQSRRQVGSIFKPIVYATFFEKAGSPNTLLSDNRLIPGEIRGAKNWNPGNADGRFTGMHPASWGLLKSRNTMSVRAGNRAGLGNVVSAALLAGFPRPPKSPGPTIYLGTWEASPLEVAGAFTAFANGGVRPTPFIIDSITDGNGHVIWKNKGEARHVFSRNAANATSAILQQITKPGGTAGSTQRLGFTAPCGGKTGTTNGYKNAWFCGFTSDLTAAVWVGFDRPVKIAEKAYGGTLALPLWVGAMQCAVARGYKMQTIRTSPANGDRAGIRLCRLSGLIAHNGCDWAGSSYTETLADMTSPRPLCTMHAPAPAANRALMPDDELAEDPDEPNPDIDDGDDETAEEVN